MQHNETGASDLGEDFGVGRVDRNETVGEVPVVNVTEQSVPASGLELEWTKEDKKIWIKYGLSPAYLKEMRKIEERLLGEHVCTTVDILEGKPLGACTELAIPEVHSGIFIDEGCAINGLIGTGRKRVQLTSLKRWGRNSRWCGGLRV